MKRFSLVIKEDQESVTIAESVKRELLNNGFIYDGENPELVCVIGGDGTFLSAVHQHMDSLDNVVFTALNTGNLGFFSDYTKDEEEQFIKDILYREPKVEEKKLLEIKVDDGVSPVKYYAVNEMRVENPIRTQVIDIYINREKLETCHGTGVSVCTQTGSTAYNRSLKGAVVESGLEIMELTEITGVHHTLFRSLGVPLILSGENVIRLKSHYEEKAVMCYDREYKDLRGEITISCTLSDRKVRIAHYRPTGYISRLFHLF